MQFCPWLILPEAFIRVLSSLGPGRRLAGNGSTAAVPLLVLGVPEGDMLSPQHVTWSWGITPVPGWQQGLVTSLMLLPDLQLSGALLLTFPTMEELKKEKHIKREK